jgi:ABC-2 type transport system ATP-binding protein
MRRRSALVAGAAVVVVAAAAVGLGVSGSPPGVRREMLSVPVGAGPDGQPVTLDATLFRPPGSAPAPAVVLAHGFGGSKDDETTDALALARRGYVALTYSARGFGRSGGQISLDSPDYEVRDAQRLIDLLGARSDVVHDGPDDPRVGFTGGSYGGALSLLVAGQDRRVDAIVPMITWNNLGQSLFPQFAVQGAALPTPAGIAPVADGGVFKRLWAGAFFSSGSALTGLPGSTDAAAAGAGPIPAPTICGRFAADACEAYQQSAATGVPTPQILTLLARSSPASVLDRITAPTLLVQGESDSLFPLSEADANARGIAATGTPVKVAWYAGGHDGGPSETDRLRSLTLSWFDRYLRRNGSPTDTRFEYSVIRSGRSSAAESSSTPLLRSAPGLPGLTGASVARQSVPVSGGVQTVVSPAGGNPAAVTSLPGLGSALSGVTTGFADLPGQSARFDSAPLADPLRLVGTPTVDLQVASSSTDATLFAKLYDVDSDGRAATLPEQLVAPIRLSGLPTTGGQLVRVALPALAHDFAAGHRLRVSISTTDQAYQLPTTARTYSIAVAGTGSVALPAVPSTTQGGGTAVLPLLAAAGALVLSLLAGRFVIRRSGGRAAGAADPALVDVPLAIEGLGKAYADGFRAVSYLTFRVDRGQVLGLLGPNGAGKTTTLRMLLGLIRPTEGRIILFGQRVVPGAPVLSRVGAFVEGPGFLPHLSGRDNLTLFWAATGRPAADAGFGTALEIAGLGADVERKVRTYSHGMRQRLAIAQAMLGLPELLVLDEPTNGLDPPQIREMREVLGRYAATGRTVVVSSHLLAEVEQTCTHCVVMHRGRLVAHGPVAELVGAATSIAVTVDDSARATEVLRSVPGVHDVLPTADGVTVRLNGVPRGQLVRCLVEAGLAVDRVAPQRRLEEVFLTLIGES